LQRYEVGKHFDLNIADDGFTCTRNEQRLAREAALGGLFAYMPSAPASRPGDSRLLRWFAATSRCLPSSLRLAA
jgi:hypothetical protein